MVWFCLMPLRGGSEKGRPREEVQMQRITHGCYHLICVRALNPMGVPAIGVVT